jgi:hypothetical protein
MAYTGQYEKGEWGLALSSAAQGSLINLVRASFFPLYKDKVVGPLIFFLSLLLLVWGVTNHYCFLESDNNSKMQGVWNMGIDGLLGNPLPVGNLTFQMG